MFVVSTARFFINYLQHFLFLLLDLTNLDFLLFMVYVSRNSGSKIYNGYSVVNSCKQPRLQQEFTMITVFQKISENGLHNPKSTRVG